MVGRMQVEWLKDWAGLKDHEDVLEVGCGIGRIAAPLTQYLRKGSYQGFDIVAHGIEWCQGRITARHPNFRFFHSDVFNKFYNPEGTLSASEFRFPFPDRSFDVVFLTWVFTHMLPDDVRHYVGEIGRVLRPGGRCYCTAFLITDEARVFIEKGETVRPFRPMDAGRYWAENPDVPEFATGYTDRDLFGMFAESAMEIRKVVPGYWWTNQFAQDTFVACKAAAPAT